MTEIDPNVVAHLQRNYTTLYNYLKSAPRFIESMTEAMAYQLALKENLQKLLADERKTVRQLELTIVKLRSKLPASEGGTLRRYLELVVENEDVPKA